MADSGPTGTGLLPPGTRRPNNSGRDESPPQDDPPTDPEDQHTDPPEDPPDDPPTDPPPDPPSDIDGVPPVPDSDRDGGGGDDDDADEIDPEQFRQEILDEMQRRFDKAISKIQRKQGRQPQSPPGGGGDDPDDDGDPPPAPRDQHRSTVDVTSIRLYGRTALNDEMETAGRSERQAVRTVLDRVLAHTDWSQIDDQQEYVDELAKTLAGNATTLIKIGSDRKLAQLRQAGVVPPSQQPGAPSSSTNSVSTGMAQGQGVAKKRWPTGRRRFGG